ncbi:MAG TPA: hypothetical protein PLN54_07425 [Flavobacteriales bacterium]|nr:hypothetical protein [Flavobacteriales bacterium]
MSTAALRTTLLVLVALTSLLHLLTLAQFFHAGLSDRFLRLDPFRWAELFVWVLGTVAAVLGAVGVVKAFRAPKDPLPAQLSFPIVFSFTASLFQLFFLLLRRPAEDAMGQPEPWWIALVWLWPLVYLATSMAYFARVGGLVPTGEVQWVGGWRRLGGWVLDILVVLSLLLMNVRALAFTGSVLDDVPYFHDSPYPLISVMLFVYFFSTEVVFLRTLGKVATGTFVVVERRRMLTILGRTLLRYIPLEAFSFLGRHTGWHDEFSNTSVRRALPRVPAASAVTAPEGTAA